MNPDALLKDLLDALYFTNVRIVDLRRKLGVEQRYVEALERQLEPSVIAEIKAELSALDQQQEEVADRSWPGRL